MAHPVLEPFDTLWKHQVLVTHGAHKGRYGLIALGPEELAQRNPDSYIWIRLGKENVPKNWARVLQMFLRSITLLDLKGQQPILYRRQLKQSWRF